jgi:hypothetical protein
VTYLILKMIKNNFQFLLVVLLLFSLGIARAEPNEWKREELTEKFMRSLSKDQCMAKTVASLKVGCHTEDCLKTLSGITGDCVTWARGDSETFCKSYVENYLSRYCASNELDARRCIVLHIGQSILCKK